ncbi:hypothetical protein D0T23_21110 [Duganella sp. BJB475]|nr:hypothetical protein D0T23_21110 [Duganella sp. BJB475]RFP29735.1 hypothetical protein D0T21_17865 [Duganella sp. BJB476]
MKKKRVWIISIAILSAVLLIVSTQITIFVVQPIGAIPEGRTLIIARLNKTEFIDSADAMCERIQGGVSIMCRVITLGAVASKSTVYARLPYSEFLYNISTNGKTYSR